MSPLTIFFAFANLIAFTFASGTVPEAQEISTETLIAAINSDPLTANAIINAVNADPNASAAVLAAAGKPRFNIPGTTTAPRTPGTQPSRGSTANCPREKKAKNSDNANY